MVCRHPDQMRLIMGLRLSAYRLRHAARHDVIYGDQIGEEDEAFARAHKVADFYREPIEVCHVVAGRVIRPAGGSVEPGPTAPPTGR
jgi:hypothetical protein